MNNNDYNAKQASSYLSGSNISYIEALYEDYLSDPDAVDPKWREYFSSLPEVNGVEKEVAHSKIQYYFYELAKKPSIGYAPGNNGTLAEKQYGVDNLIAAYQLHGHLAADTNPLKIKNNHFPNLLAPETYRLSQGDMNHTFTAPGSLLGGQTKATLKTIIDALQETYCTNIGSEYQYIREAEEVSWIQNRLEQTRAKLTLNKEQKLTILDKLIAADGLEKYLGKKYVGQKRFSLEGGDSFIPMLYEMGQCAGAWGAKEMIIGMAHRGRLNVLVNIMGQAPRDLFDAFEGKKEVGQTSGDVKYHMGFSSDINTPGGPLHLSLAFNPSHLEMISSVVMGSARARQHLYAADPTEKVVPILVHGDAAFAGQGIVMETLNMSQTRAYGVGGSIHIVLNNQVGFTTSNPKDARSSLYCTDIAKMIDAPVFHVNGDDPEAVIFVSRLAMDYRMKYKKDVVIDLVCYRLHGHNEADEPSATQPMMYHLIRQHKAPWKMYAEKLIKEGVCTQEQADNRFNAYRDRLDNDECVVDLIPEGLSYQREVHWKPYLNQSWDLKVETGVAIENLKSLGKRLIDFPKGFTLQRQVAHVVEARKEMAAGEKPLDWGFAENLAYATLLTEGHPVRMSGQDCRRGTFAHRHAVFHDQKNGDEFTPLLHLDSEQATFDIYDSLLSEAGVVGFEFGYAKTDPGNLVIWEAQFGDFANGAQVFIDQFISSGWQKWERLSGLVMLLPHGYEGMGPEHSSARLERYLQLCAEENIQVCVPTTPAQIFHLLRRQVLRPYRKPLIVMSPKSLLRHRLAVSSLEALSEGGYQTILPEVDKLSAKHVKKVVLCSGKVYYDLLERRREKEQTDVAIVRIEQLYPFPYDRLKSLLANYPHAQEIVWCQEEPKNQGAWFITQSRLQTCLREKQTLRYVGRPASASTAVGYPALHIKQQKKLVEEALA